MLVGLGLGFGVGVWNRAATTVGFELESLGLMLWAFFCSVCSWMQRTADKIHSTLHRCFPKLLAQQAMKNLGFFNSQTEVLSGSRILEFRVRRWFEAHDI